MKGVSIVAIIVSLVAIAISIPLITVDMEKVTACDRYTETAAEAIEASNIAGDRSLDVINSMQDCRLEDSDSVECAMLVTARLRYDEALLAAKELHDELDLLEFACFGEQ